MKTATRKTTTKPAAKTAAPIVVTMPALKKGEHRGGLILKEDGTPDYWLIGLPGEFRGPWEKAKAWAEKQGGELPNLRELGLERVNARQHYTDGYYWSCEKLAADPSYAWVQHFYGGFQSSTHVDIIFRARAVRRVKI